MAMNKMKAYAAYEKTENVLTKKKELKTGESKKEKARETKVGMQMMKGKPMKNSAMKKMGKKK
ncbi:MAG: hypothetical protein NT035_00405 [Burkholderiales bacterium]|nr:hypothetical protein [Burkholderiales bacterium]